VTSLEARVRECVKLGYHNIILPFSAKLGPIENAKIISAKNISDLVKKNVS
jgi:predicted ATP-dependent serine protease